MTVSDMVAASATVNRPDSRLALNFVGKKQ